MRAITEKLPEMIEKQQLREEARADGRFTLDFGVLTLAAKAIATFGLLENSTITLVSGAVLSILFAALLTRAVSFPSLGSEIMARSQPDLLDLGIALAAGAVAAFARIRPSIAGAVAGTAIAVALMPPLRVVGIGIADMDGTLARGALLLFLTNLFGIMLASMVVFVSLGYARLRRAGRGLV